MTAAEMPGSQQLFNLDVHYICPWHSPDCPSETNMGPSSAAFAGGLGGHASFDGQHQKLWRIPRDFARREPTLHPIFRYEQLPPWYCLHMSGHVDPLIRRIPDRPHLHRRWHPVDHQKDQPGQLCQAGQDSRGDTRHSAIPERGLFSAAGRRAAGLRTQQHASRGGCARDVRQELADRTARA